MEDVAALADRYGIAASRALTASASIPASVQRAIAVRVSAKIGIDGFSANSAGSPMYSGGSSRNARVTSS